MSGLGAWSASAYEAFHDLRLRPALDLLARVPDPPEGDIVDLGCGAGAAAPALRARFPGRLLIGVDGSADMLARADGLFDGTREADIAAWAPTRPPALIFSNAALHWLDDHERLFPRLFAALAPGGVLAVQMPDQLCRPSHTSMIAAAAGVRPDLFTGWTPFPGPRPLPDYAALLPGAEIDLWASEYMQRLDAREGHPVRAFTSSTGGRPVLARLDEAEAARFNALWDAALERAYPRLADGSCWFPFRRVFLVARRADQSSRRPIRAGSEDQ
ncbi:MAG: methyltransferase domain-containing protein [Pikeienuella sp.]